MNAMKLFYSPTSPYARKVRLLILEKKLDTAIEMVTVNTATPSAELLALNPLGKIPTLGFSSGEALFDSPVICRYLDTLTEPKLLPNEGKIQWEALYWEALADGLSDAAYNLVMEQRSRPEQERSPSSMARWTLEIQRTLTHIEAHLDGLDDRIHLGHLALAAAIGYLQFRLPHLLMSTTYPKLIPWFESFDQRPAMQATRPS